MANGPVQSFGWVDNLPKKKTGKRLKLEDTYKPLIERLKDTPGKYAKLVVGKTLTIVRTRKRLAEVYGAAGFEFTTRASEEAKQSELYGRWVQPLEPNIFE